LKGLLNPFPLRMVKLKKHGRDNKEQFMTSAYSG
jgi:hypothetical protein